MISLATVAQSPRDGFSYPLSDRIFSERYLQDWRDWYARLLLDVLAKSHFKELQQPGVHATFGQVGGVVLQAFERPNEVPSIQDIWSDASALPQWVAEVLQLCEEGREDAALKEISLAIGRSKVRSRFKQLSADLQHFDLEKLTDVILVALLRNTYSTRSLIPFWSSLLEKTEVILSERRREPRYMLRGLKNYL